MENQTLHQQQQQQPQPQPQVQTPQQQQAQTQSQSQIQTHQQPQNQTQIQNKSQQPIHQSMQQHPSQQPQQQPHGPTHVPSVYSQQYSHPPQEHYYNHISNQYQTPPNPAIYGHYPTQYSNPWSFSNSYPAQPSPMMVSSQLQSNVPQPRTPAYPTSNRIHNHNISAGPVQNNPNANRVKTLAILKDPKTKEVVALPNPVQNASKLTNSNSTSTIPTTNTKTSTTTKSSSTNKASISSSSSTLAETPQILLKKIADVQTNNSEDDEKDSVTTSESDFKAKQITNKSEVTEITIKSETQTKNTDKQEIISDSSTNKSEDNLDHTDNKSELISDSAEKSDSNPEGTDDKPELKSDVTDNPQDSEITDKSEETNDDNDKSDMDADPYSAFEYEKNQYHPIKNRSGNKIYSIPFLKDVGYKLCNIKLNTEQEHLSEGKSRIDIFAPRFAHQSNHLNDSARHNQSGYPSKNVPQDKPRKIIQAPTSTQEVELKTASNPWRPSKEVKEDDTEALKKKFRSILNKLTPDNFTNLATNVTELNIDTEEKLGDVIDIVFAKALAEPGYCVLYGEMCSHLKQTTAGATNFGNTLLKRCQAQFQADIYSGLNLKERDEKIEMEADPDIKKQLSDELYEEKYRCRMRGLGLIKFIGELYKIDMLNDTIMMDCMYRLLQDVSEESLECLCDLLVTIGEKLDKGQKEKKIDKNNQQKPTKNTNTKSNQSAPQSYRNVAATPQPINQQQTHKTIYTLDQIFEDLHKIRKAKDGPQLSVRIKFKLLDTCELREKNQWHSKQSKDNNPKKLEEIREGFNAELEQERVRNALNNNSNGPRRNMDKRLGHAGGSSSQISSMDNPPNRGAPGMHTSSSSHSIGGNSSNDTRNNSNNSDIFQKSKEILSKTLMLNSDKKADQGLRPSFFNNKKNN